MSKKILANCFDVRINAIPTFLLKKDEAVAFSWICIKSRVIRKSSSC